jgi:hypothetical protein
MFKDKVERISLTDICGYPLYLHPVLERCAADPYPLKFYGVNKCHTGKYWININVI